MSTTTANMNLQLPTVNVDNGLTWEMDVNYNTQIIDAHNHSSGNGVQIPPSGLNINSDLSFQNNSAIGLKSLILTDQTSDAVFNSIYSVAGELYWNDGASNVVKITSGGTVNATSSGISSGTASASFVSSVLVVNAAAATPANIQVGSVLLGNNVASSNFLTLAPPAAMASSFSLTLPNLPASQKFMTLDASGNIAAPWAVDGSTLEINANTLQVKSSGITATQIANNAVITSKILDGNVTKPKLSAVGQQISSSSSVFGVLGTTFVDVPGLTTTITTTGRLVFVGLIPDGSSSTSQIEASTVTTVSVFGEIRLLRDGSVLGDYQFGIEAAPNGSVLFVLIPVSSVNSYDDSAPAGSHTYKVQMRGTAATTQITISNAKLITYEL